MCHQKITANSMWFCSNLNWATENVPHVWHAPIAYENDLLLTRNNKQNILLEKAHMYKAQRDVSELVIF